MLNRRLISAASLVLAAGAAASAQSLSTGFDGTVVVTSDQLHNGNMFDLTAYTTGGLTVNSFDLHCNAPVGTPITVDLYTKAGTYVGSTTTSGDWTLVGTTGAISAGPNNPTPLALGGVAIAHNQTQGFYVNIREIGASVRYFTAAGLPSFNPANDDLSIGVRQGSAIGGLFGPNVFAPRGWNGTVYYTAVGAALTGACCSPSGTCDVRTQGSCISIGGTYGGDGTTCGDIICVGGACCLNDGTCQVITPAACAGVLGAYMGDSTTCGSITCPLSAGFGGSTFIAEGAANAGILFDLQCLNPNGVSISGFDINARATAGSTITVQVYTRPGTITGAMNSSAGWTLHEAVTTTAAGGFAPTPVPFTTSFNIAGGQSTGVYINIVEAGGLPLYSGLALLPHLNPVNDDLRLAVNYGGAKNGLFAASSTVPRGFSGRVYYTPGGASPTGACCLADATCVVATLGGCEAQFGVYQGDATSCGVCPGFVLDVEVNNTRDNAVAATLASGQSLVGVSSGVATVATGDVNTVDYYRVKTVPAAPGIYRHRIDLNSEIVGHSAWIRGLGQTATGAAPWAGAVGTANTTENAGQTHQLDGTSRVNYWYGFGKEEEVYYRIAGTGSTATASGTWRPYVATLVSTPVSPTDIGTFNAGGIDITTTGQGHTSDTHLRIYDSNFEPVHGFANDNASLNGGAPASTTTTSFLRREYTAGTYYMAIAITNLATNQGAPSDDNTRTGAMMDFPNVAVETGTSTVTDVGFAVTDSAGTVQFPASRDGRNQLAWFKFTVVGAVGSGACCFEDGTCTFGTSLACAAANGVYSGNDTTCEPNTCPQPGACCFTFGCIVGLESMCVGLNGVFQGGGSVCSACPAPTIQDRLIAMDSNRALYELDRATGARTQIGTVSANVGTAAGLARDHATGTVYVVSTSNDSLFTLDLDTGDATLIGQFDTSLVMHGLEFDDSTNTLYGGSNGSLYVIDKGTGAATLVGNSGITGFLNLGYNSDTDVLYGVNSTTDAFYTVDRGTGALTLVGALDGSTSPNGMAYDTAAKVMFLVDNTTDSLYAINMQTGAATLMGPSGTSNFLGLVYIPEDAPASCYANCDESTTAPVLNVGDFTCFLQRFAAGESYANCDNSTTVPVLNVGDFTCFLQQFAAGCP